MNKISHTSDILAAEQELRDTFYTRHGKRAFDLAFAILMLPPLLPIIFVLALLVKLDGGPAFFGHKRVGKGGRVFRCLKLRTMRPDAEIYLKKHLAANEPARTEWLSNFKLRNDPRITKLGKYLRDAKLDELPQIFNVLNGNMSFVGSRPVTSEELLKYGKYVSVYKKNKPGITGYWQVKQSEFLIYSERVKCDLKYSRDINFWLDLKLILMTIKIVLSRFFKTITGHYN